MVEIAKSKCKSGNKDAYNFKVQIKKAAKIEMEKGEK